MSRQGRQFSFAEVPRAEIPRSVFNRSHGHKTTLDAGKLVPLYVDEVLPGDTFDLRASIFARMTTPLVPIMDNLYLDIFFFFVPNRLIWSNWQKFCGEQDNPDDPVDFLVPQVNTIFSAASQDSKDLWNYLGVPILNLTGGVALQVNSLPARAYNLVYNEWFRDENLQDKVTVDLDDGPDAGGDYKILRRGKRHDYFTSCLPWPQKGEAVTIPVGRVVSDPLEGGPKFQSPGNSAQYLHTGASGPPYGVNLQTGSSGGQDLAWADPSLIVDQALGGATINSLRQAFQVQKLLERDARGGTRYTEIVKSHFGVTSPDARLQRPEFLGGGTFPVVFHSVPQTSETGTTAQGYLAAFGLVNGQKGFVKSFVEHGILLGIASVRADYTYQQGLHRMYSRRTKYDFFWPALAHLGEQAVLSKEIYCKAHADDELVFGYQERWAEYKYHPSRVSGKMHSQASGTMDFWHLAQEFSSRPELNEVFIKEDPPVDRVVANPAEPDFLVDCFFSVKAARPMPTYSVPGMVDHF